MNEFITLLNWVFQDFVHFAGTVILIATTGASLGFIFHGTK